MMTGWNGTFAAKGLLDHTAKGIARPNNDTLYVASTLDLRNEPVIVHYPAFDSKYVALDYFDRAPFRFNGKIEQINIRYTDAKEPDFSKSPDDD